VANLTRTKHAASILLLAAGLLAQVATEAQSASGAARPDPSPAAASPSLLLVTIDTWRWDYIGASRAGKVETPNLDRLAREGIYEPETVTPCPLTTPAHASLFTGTEPRRHGVWDCTRYTLAEGLPTLAEAFRSAGFHTAAFVACEALKRRYGLDRGFDLYDESGIARRRKGDWMAASRDGAEVTGAVLNHLRAQRPGARVMVWAHYFDLHLPYRPRPAFDSKHPKDPYAAQAEFVDGQIGILLAAIRADRARSWRVVVVADHGESLGEKGEATHGIGLYRSTLHVPLVVHPRPAQPMTHPKPWGLIDLAPTIREWFDLPDARRSDGESLFRVGAKERAMIAVSIEPVLLFNVNPTIGVRQGQYQYLRFGEEELYDLAVDPAEKTDLSGRQGERGTLEKLRALFDRTWPRTWLRAALPPSLNPTPEELKALQSLGYLSGGTSSAAKFQRARIDRVMKDRSDWENAREESFRTGRDDSLLKLYPRLVSAYPGSFALHKAYGTLLAKEGRPQEAMNQLEEAVRINPKDSATLTNLGTLYLSQGRIDTGRAFLEEALKLDPVSPVAHKSMGILYADHLGDPEKAVFHYQKYLDAGGDAEAGRIRAYVDSMRVAGKPSPPHGN
jgi:arylsulfatase A-like enzyme